MPCYATGSAEGDARLAADQARAEVTNLTRLLCDLCAHVEKSCYGNVIRELPAVNEWWLGHKALDAERRKQKTAEEERAIHRNNALNKLTSEEKEALGLWP